MCAQEAGKEKQRQRGQKQPKSGMAARVTLKRPRPETAPALGFQAKKSQPIRVGILVSGGGTRNRTRVRNPSQIVTHRPGGRGFDDLAARESLSNASTAPSLAFWQNSAFMGLLPTTTPVHDAGHPRHSPPNAWRAIPPELRQGSRPRRISDPPRIAEVKSIL